MGSSSTRLENTVIFGTGLAGLSAGYELSKAGVKTILIERNPAVGGLAETLVHGEFRFDLGGHRFITRTKTTEQLVRQAVEGRLLVVKRSSQIVLRGKYFDYPIRPLNALFGLGIRMSARILVDYFAEQFKKQRGDRQVISLEDWVVENFGRTLFNIYFKEYSEKLWGVDCSRISVDWVANRIQGLSLTTAVKKAFRGPDGEDMRTLAGEFLYPVRGIGQIADGLRKAIEKRNTILTNAEIVQVTHVGHTVKSVAVRHGGETFNVSGREFISSIPLTTLIQLLRPKPPVQVRNAAGRLRYRDLVIVAVMVDRERVTDQTWMYFPEKAIPFARIHEPTNWSRDMAPPGQSLVVAEHFCFRGDIVWNASDAQLVEKTVASLTDLQLLSGDEVVDSVVVRVPKAYPLFEVGYAEHYQQIFNYLSRYSNLHLVGRGGLFQYYNMDHAMESGIAAAGEVLARQIESADVLDDRLARTGTGA